MTEVVDQELLDAEPEAQGFAGVPMPGPWVRFGTCRAAPPALFFIERGESSAPAKAICRKCAVRDECLEYALAHPPLTGIWAGTTAKDRRGLRADREMQAAAIVEPDTAGPPAAERGTLYRTLEQLAEHPGQWARVARFAAKHSAPAMASMLRTGRKPRPPGEWQFEGRLNDLGGSDLYALFESAEQTGVAS